MDTGFHTAVLSRECPTCKAREGWECSDSSGRKTTIPHSPRCMLVVKDHYRAWNKERFSKNEKTAGHTCPPHAYVFKGLSEDESQWVWQCVKCPHQDVEAIDGD